MPRTPVTPQRVDVLATAVTLEPANVLGNSLALDARRVLLVRNGSAAAVTVTLPTTATVEGLIVPDRTVSVPAAADRFIRLSGNSVQTDGTVSVNYSAVTSVTVAYLEV